MNLMQKMQNHAWKRTLYITSNVVVVVVVVVIIIIIIIIIMPENMVVPR